MYDFKIGILLDSLKLDYINGFKKTREIGASGVQINATNGAFSPSVITKATIKEFMKNAKGSNMVVSALCGDFNYGFTDASKNPNLLEKSKRIIDLALQLETNIMTTHLGVIPEDTNSERYKILQQACFELGNYAQTMDSYIAIETGPEKAIVLKKFLDELGSKHVAVNFDPANLVMVTGDDPVEAVYTLQDYIVHTHVKDGIKLAECDVEYIYENIEDQLNCSLYFKEVPIGEGSVDFPQYFKALHEIGYRGFLTIERETGDNPILDISNAVEFIKSHI